VVVVGAAIGAGLGRWDMSHAKTTGSADRVTTAPGTDPQVPAGLIRNGTVAQRPAIHNIDNRVFVVGDSVMQGAAPYLSADLPSWSIIADTEVGRFLDQANTVIAKSQKNIGKIVVLNLGNNYNGDKAQFAAQVQTALTELSGVEHVIWINVAEFQDDRADVNDVLDQAAVTHPNLTIVDWNSWWSANRSFTGADHLHLTDDGARAYASLVGAAVTRVTDAAGEVPAPGVSKPSLNTSGTIPGSKGQSAVSQPYRPRTTVRHTVTTAHTSTPVSVTAGGSGEAPGTTAAAPSPPTSAATVDTTPKVTSGSAPPVTPPHLGP
jgi:hypothetical protein